MQTKFRIVPIINGYRILFEVQFKTFLFWKPWRIRVSSGWGDYYQDRLFNSIKDAREAIEARHGTIGIYNLVAYRP